MILAPHRFALTALVASLIVLTSLAPSRDVALAASSKSGEVARTIPTGVFELLVGGSWEADKASGYYRAVALGAGKAGEEHAEVWLQWIAVDKTDATVTKNIEIAEITKLKVPSLTLAMDVEQSGSVILIVTHFATEDGEPATLEFSATAPGKYAPIVAQIASDAEQPAAQN
ncbi:MAG: hypothetical protein AAFZ01_13785 [Pseudomonadota bacterium]